MDRESYRRYLRSPHWRAFRASFAYNHPCCCICKSRASLEVNHMGYSNLGHESSADAVMFCRVHHQEFHDRLRFRGWPVEPGASWAIYREMAIAYASPRRLPRSRGWRRSLFGWRLFR